MPSVVPISSWAEETDAEYGRKKDYRIITGPRYNTSVALRKGLKKLGDCANDKPGVNPDRTLIGEEVRIQFISCEDADKIDDNLLERLKEQKSLVKCRTCNGDHWTLNCPFKDQITAGSVSDGANKAQKYVPPS